MRTLCSRRLFFWQAVDETLAAVERSFGRPSHRLSDLPLLNWEQLAELCPLLLPGNDACGGLAGDSPETDFFLDRMDGTRSLGELADEAATTFGLTLQASESLAREVFLTLTAKGLAYPANCPP